MRVEPHVVRGPHTTLGNTLAGLGFLGIKFLHGMDVRDELLMCHHLWDHFILSKNLVKVTELPTASDRCLALFFNMEKIYTKPNFVSD